MKLEGLIGEITYTEDIEQFITFLLIVKETNFELEKYEILSKIDG